MKVFILLSVVAVAFANQCGENEHYESCGTACPLTCDNYENPPKACVLMCEIGCHCDEGYVRSPEGRCIEPIRCPERSSQVCGENERYLECGTACPLTCDNYANPPLICPAMCVIGCHCEEGYVKTRDGKCVRPGNCPSNARPIAKTCLAKPDPGNCLAYVPSWAYDVQTGECHEFIYGGCQGNGNNYATYEACMDHCRDVKLREVTASACDLPAETGVCRGFFPRYYFDRTTGQCQKFVYGGCGGNENNFETIQQCQESCGEAIISAGPSDLCTKKEFRCRKGAVKCIPIEWRCDLTKDCTDGSDEEGCALSAPQACQEEKVVGSCKAAFKRFFFNTKTGQCEEFIYGGCDGNSNNFNSKEGCEAVCIE